MSDFKNLQFESEDVIKKYILSFWKIDNNDEIVFDTKSQTEIHVKYPKLFNKTILFRIYRKTKEGFTLDYSTSKSHEQHGKIIDLCRFLKTHSKTVATIDHTIQNEEYDTLFQEWDDIIESIKDESTDAFGEKIIYCSVEENVIPNGIQYIFTRKINNLNLTFCVTKYNTKKFVIQGRNHSLLQNFISYLNIFGINIPQVNQTLVTNNYKKQHTAYPNLHKLNDEHTLNILYTSEHLCHSLSSDTNELYDYSFLLQPCCRVIETVLRKYLKEQTGDEHKNFGNYFDGEQLLVKYQNKISSSAKTFVEIIYFDDIKGIRHIYMHGDNGYGIANLDKNEAIKKCNQIFEHLNKFCGIL